MPALRQPTHPALLPRNRRRSSVFTPAKPGIYTIGGMLSSSNQQQQDDNDAPTTLSQLPPRPISFAPNITPISFVESSDSDSPSSPEEGSNPFSDNPKPKLFPPSDTPAPAPTRKRQPPGKRRSQGYIPRPPNAFMLFRADFVRQKHVPGSIETNHGSLSKIIGNCWRSLPLDEKKIWEQRAKVEKAAHKVQYPNYRFKPVHKKKGLVSSTSASIHPSTSGPPSRHPSHPASSNNLASTTATTNPTANPEEEDIRCEQVTQLLLSGKKGDELARAVKELDEARARQKARQVAKSSSNANASSNTQFNNPFALPAPGNLRKYSITPGPLMFSSTGPRMSFSQGGRLSFSQGLGGRMSFSAGPLGSGRMSFSQGGRMSFSQGPHAGLGALLSAPQPTYPNVGFVAGSGPGDSLAAHAPSEMDPAFFPPSEGFNPHNAAAGSFLHLRRSSSVPLPGAYGTGVGAGYDGFFNYAMGVGMEGIEGMEDYYMDMGGDMDGGGMDPMVDGGGMDQAHKPLGAAELLPPPPSGGITGIANSSLNVDVGGPLSGVGVETPLPSASTLDGGESVGGVQWGGPFAPSSYASNLPGYPTHMNAGYTTNAEDISNLDGAPYTTGNMSLHFNLATTMDRGRASISRHRALLGHRRSSSAGPAFGGVAVRHQQLGWVAGGMHEFGFVPMVGGGLDTGAGPGGPGTGVGTGNMLQRDDSPLPEADLSLFNPSFLSGHGHGGESNGGVGGVGGGGGGLVVDPVLDGAVDPLAPLVQGPLVGVGVGAPMDPLAPLESLEGTLEGSSVVYSTHGQSPEYPPTSTHPSPGGYQHPTPDYSQHPTPEYSQQQQQHASAQDQQQRSTNEMYTGRAGQDVYVFQTYPVEC